MIKENTGRFFLTFSANAIKPLRSKTLENFPLIRSNGKSSASNTRKPNAMKQNEGGAI